MFIAYCLLFMINVYSIQTKYNIVVGNLCFLSRHYLYMTIYIVLDYKGMSYVQYFHAFTKGSGLRYISTQFTYFCPAILSKNFIFKLTKILICCIYDVFSVYVSLTRVSFML